MQDTTRRAPLDLRGHRALVTGAGQRVGQAIAVALGRRGLHVAVHYGESEHGAEETAARIRALGWEATLFRADLTDRDRARQLVDDCVEALGGLDLLVLSAGTMPSATLGEIDDKTWDAALHLNLAVPFVLAQRAAGALTASRGSIVCITCASTGLPYRGCLPYVVAKGGQSHLIRALAVELAPHVRVNGVAPGLVLPPPAMTAETIDRLRARLPLGEIGHAEDVAETVVFLAENPFVTGQELFVDGGRSLGSAR